MSDLIRREDAINAMSESLKRVFPEHQEIAEKSINAVPSAEPERKHGKWIEKSTGGDHFDCCSECGYVEWDAPNNYCPACGARMNE